MKTNHDRLARGEQVEPKSIQPWRSRGCSVMTREDAGVDAADPWIASCDLHGEMLACLTRKSAIAAAKSRDWCSGCQIPSRPFSTEAEEITRIHRAQDEYAADRD